MKRRKDPTSAAPTPGEVTLQIQAIVVGLQQLATDYQGTYLAAYGPAVVGDGGRAGGTSDPTGNHATSPARQQLRRACVRATADLGEVQATIRSALYKLDNAMPAVDPPPSANLRLEDQMRVSRAELRDSREAQDRRNGRGEGWGG